MTYLEKELEKKQLELQAAFSHASRISTGKDNGIRKEIWSDSQSARSDLSEAESQVNGHDIMDTASGDSPSAIVSPNKKQSRLFMASLFHGFSWDKEDENQTTEDIMKYLSEEPEPEIDLPKYVVKILPVVVPGITVEDENGDKTIFQEPKTMHMAVNVKVDPPEKKMDSVTTSEQPQSDALSIDGCDDTASVSELSDLQDPEDSLLNDSIDDFTDRSGSDASDDSEID